MRDLRFSDCGACVFSSSSQSAPTCAALVPKWWKTMKTCFCRTVRRVCVLLTLCSHRLFARSDIFGEEDASFTRTEVKRGFAYVDAPILKGST